MTSKLDEGSQLHTNPMSPQYIPWIQWTHWPSAIWQDNGLRLARSPMHCSGGMRWSGSRLTVARSCTTWLAVGRLPSKNMYPGIPSLAKTDAILREQPPLLKMHLWNIWISRLNSCPTYIDIFRLCTRKHTSLCTFTWTTHKSGSWLAGMRKCLGTTSPGTHCLCSSLLANSLASALLWETSTTGSCSSWAAEPSLWLSSVSSTKNSSWYFQWQVMADKTAGTQFIFFNIFIVVFVAHNHLDVQKISELHYPRHINWHLENSLLLTVSSDMS